MGDSKGAAAVISDGAAGSPQTVTGVEIRRCLTPLLFNGSGRAFGTRSGRRPGVGGVPTISGVTVSIPAWSCVVDSGVGSLDPPFLVSWGSSVPTLAGTPADSSQPRIDVVYVRVDEVLGAPTTQTITFGYQAGTASSSPQPPTTVGGDNLPIRQVCVLGYLNVPASGGGAATVTPGRDLALANAIIRCNGPSDYPTAANCVDGTVLWDYSPAVREFVVLVAGAWSVRQTGNPKVKAGTTTVTPSGLGTGTVPFGITFPGVPVVVATPASAASNFASVQIGTVTASGFDYRIRKADGTLLNDANVIIAWTAVYG